MTIATLAATGVTLFVWNRDQPRSSFSVQPTEKGGAATYTKSW